MTDSSSPLTDAFLEQQIKDLQHLIIAWARAKDLWTDASFHSYLEWFDDEPSDTSAQICVLVSDGMFLGMLDGFYGSLLDEFQSLLEPTPFYYEMEKRCAVFYCSDDALNATYVQYFEWRWICKLIEPDYTGLYDELYAYFRADPSRLQALHHRKLEILVSELFRNQGYQTILGPGGNDGGVDLRLIQRSGIDTITTLVQVKRYHARLPIRLDAVAALLGHLQDQQADKGLFVTTSSDLPVVHGFDSRHPTKLELADSTNIAQWSGWVENRIVRDKSQALTDAAILKLLKHPPAGSYAGRIAVASVGYGIVDSEFCMILIDEPHVVLLMRLSADETYLDHPYNTRGTAVPCQDERILQNKVRNHVFRAKKWKAEDGSIRFAGRQHHYWIWDGVPRYFDYND